MTALSDDQLLDRFNAALGSGDREGMLAVYSDDAIVWHNYDQVEMSGPAHADSIAAIVGAGGGFDIDVKRRLPLRDGGVVQEVDLVMATPDGGKRVMPACQIIDIRDGAIVRIDEYIHVG